MGFDDWELLISNKDVDGLYTEYDVLCLRLKCKYLYKLVDTLLKEYDTKTFIACVELSLFLDSNPDVKNAIATFCSDNLAILTGELLHEYISENACQLY